MNKNCKDICVFFQCSSRVTSTENDFNNTVDRKIKDSHTRQIFPEKRWGTRGTHWSRETPKSSQAYVANSPNSRGTRRLLTRAQFCFLEEFLYPLISLVLVSVLCTFSSVLWTLGSMLPFPFLSFKIGV